MERGPVTRHGYRPPLTSWLGSGHRDGGQGVAAPWPHFSLKEMIMVNGKDLWGIVHALGYKIDRDGLLSYSLQTECGLRDPLRGTDEPVDCAYCITHVERRKVVREVRAAKEAELEQLRLTDTEAYMKERERFWRGRRANF